MNKSIIIGNLARDPECHQTTGGRSCTTFTVAVNRRFVDKQTGKREADYLNVVTWNQLADNCGRYLAKGRKVAVVGAIQTRSYMAQDGTKRYVTEIIADEVEFLSAVQDRGDAYEEPQRYFDARSSGDGVQQSFDDQNDELPF